MRDDSCVLALLINPSLKDDLKGELIPEEMKRVVCYIVCILSISVIVTSCTKVRDLFDPPSPREKYMREFEAGELRLLLWESAYERALDDRIVFQLPYRETGYFFPDQMQVYSYETELREGEVFHFDLLTEDTETRVFIDFFRIPDERAEAAIAGNPVSEGEQPGIDYIMQNDPLDRYLQARIDETGVYKIVIQPEIPAYSGFSFSAYTLPSLGFPVAGKSNSDIQSFWGASRDGGRRSHEGIDIFAPRGTPVVAAEGGYVSSTGDRGLGGKQVWVRTGLFGSSHYYAHLDSIAVSGGSRVQTGDTLGFVGNTGNAITTSPHLHYGIYTSHGAVDPLPYVYEREPVDAPPMLSEPGSMAVLVESQTANLRLQASLQGEVTGQVQQQDTLRLMGITENWRHIQTSDGLRAYIHESLIR